METKTEEKKQVKIFREKNLEAMESPESLNDYLRVTSPGVWLVLTAVILVLVGVILWGVFGSIDTQAELAVASEGGKAVCYVPYELLEQIMKGGEVAVGEERYPLSVGSDFAITIVTEEMNPYIRVAGGLKIGDVTVEVPLEGAPADGFHTGTVVTERLRPISLLLQ